MSSVQSWTGDAIDVALAADFDGSLSCLGIELGTENYDMSAPLHSLIQSVSSPEYISQENDSPSPSQEDPFSPLDSIRSSYSVQPKKTRLALNADEEATSAIKRFCVSSEDKENSDSSQSSRCRHSSSVPDLRMTGSVLSPNTLSQMLQISDSPPPPPPPPSYGVSLKNSGFQYVLGAATSIATKINEETMTYLNQGQSYEIKLKKLGDLTEMCGKMLKSIIRVGFQERRLQYSEKEQITQWQKQRPNERILEIDIPLSYGVYDISNDPTNIHICEFLWDPTNETGVFVRLNCISTEFTPKKHGGEKGAPFRIQIETFSHTENDCQRLHVASCQVKVFKPKGADRKHKTDREKMSRRPQSEQDKYKTSYDCTVFSECSPDLLYITNCPSAAAASSAPVPFLPSPKINDIKSVRSPPKQPCKSKTDSVDLSDMSSYSLEKFPSTDSIEASSDICIKEEPDPPLKSPEIIGKQNPDISPEFTIKETVSWLMKNNFSDSVDLFTNYNGTDMLRLSQDDCIKICGITNGVRLFNSLHAKPVLAKKVFYVRMSMDEVFQVVYLHELTSSYMITKLSVLFHIPLDTILDLHLQTGTSIHYSISDEVVANLLDESLFILEIILHDPSEDKCILLLRPFKED